MSVLKIIEILNLFPQSDYSIFLDVLKRVNYDITSFDIEISFMKDLAIIDSDKLFKWVICINQLRSLLKRSESERVFKNPQEIIKVNPIVEINTIWEGFINND